MEKKKINRETITLHLIEKQLALIGKTPKDLEDNPEGLREWTLTEEQYDQFKAYSLPILKKVFKYNTNKARGTFEWFNLTFGLRVKQDE